MGCGERKMQGDLRKKYEKPKLTKIRLDPETAVLGKCKTVGKRGPAKSDCGFPFPICREMGS